MEVPRRAILTGLFAVLAFVAATQTGFAHHSFASEFDANTPMNLKGVVTKVEWKNPHTYFYLDVTGADGKVANWALEMGSPNALMRQGWTRNTLNIGDKVTVEGSPAKDGSHVGNANAVVLADSGRRLFAASRSRKAAPNDADRLRKYLARFGLDWKGLRAEAVVSSPPR